MDSPHGGVRGPRIVALGGGSGPSLIARSLPEHVDRFTAVVSVADSGSSTGVIRDAFGLPAPGDVRAAIACLVRLSDPQSPWADLLEHRFQPRGGGPLANMALGNLLLTALASRAKSFTAAVCELVQLMGARGRVLPVTDDPLHLAAQLADGSVVRGEISVRAPDKPSIRSLFVEGAQEGATQAALQAIREADVLFIGPGNLFTSVAACLVVPGVVDAIAACRGQRVYIPNTTSYPGQSDGLSAFDHVETVRTYLRGVPLHFVLLNEEHPASRVAAVYAAQGVRFIPVTTAEIVRIEGSGVRAVSAALLEPPVAEPRKLHKLDTIRHDASKLGRLVRHLFGMEPARRFSAVA
jgi:uncharacterized cofD-like protein